MNPQQIPHQPVSPVIPELPKPQVTELGPAIRWSFGLGFMATVLGTFLLFPIGIVLLLFVGLGGLLFFISAGNPEATKNVGDVINDFLHSYFTIGHIALFLLASLGGGLLLAGVTLALRRSNKRYASLSAPAQAFTSIGAVWVLSNVLGCLYIVIARTFNIS